MTLWQQHRGKRGSTEASQQVAVYLWYFVLCCSERHRVVNTDIRREKSEVCREASISVACRV